MSPALDEALKAAADAHQMTVSATGGMRKNKGKLRLDILPPSWVRALARILGKGAIKYEDRNWEKGLSFMVTLACAERHILAFKSGEDIDAETGEPHAALAAWNMLALMEFQRRIAAGTLPASLDDRPLDWRDTPPPAPVPVPEDWARCHDCMGYAACGYYGQCITATMRACRDAGP